MRHDDSLLPALGIERGRPSASATAWYLVIMFPFLLLAVLFQDAPRYGWSSKTFASERWTDQQL
jgi:hypothetical protein